MENKTILNAKIDYNIKQLNEAEENNDSIKVKKFTKNIEHYKKQLDKVIKYESKPKSENNAKKYTNDFVAVAIKTKGNQGIEIIINPAYNFDQKLEYYNKAYNDDLILNTYNGISIISACSFDYDIEFTEIEEMLQNKF